jgi:hypothetical protein
LVAAEEIANFGPREAIWARAQLAQKLVSDWIAKGIAENEPCRVEAVAPDLESGFKVGAFDRCGQIEKCVEHRDTHDLGLSAACDRTQKAGHPFGELGVAFSPKCVCSVVSKDLPPSSSELDGLA